MKNFISYFHSHQFMQANFQFLIIKNILINHYENNKGKVWKILAN